MLPVPYDASLSLIIDTPWKSRIVCSSYFEIADGTKQTVLYLELPRRRALSWCVLVLQYSIIIIISSAFLVWTFLRPRGWWFTMTHKWCLLNDRKIFLLQGIGTTNRLKTPHEEKWHGSTTSYLSICSEILRKNSGNDDDFPFFLLCQWNWNTLSFSEARCETD